MSKNKSNKEEEERDFQLNDAVIVERAGLSHKNEGVVAYLGKVKFAKGRDWVGVRLTGASVGLGKNDGSVQGVSYFLCPANCGIFVKKQHIRRRNMNRLEELRLRRELARPTTTTSIKGPSPRKQELQKQTSDENPDVPLVSAPVSPLKRQQQLRHRRPPSTTSYPQSPSREPNQKERQQYPAIGSPESLYTSRCKAAVVKMSPESTPKRHMRQAPPVHVVSSVVSPSPKQESTETQTTTANGKQTQTMPLKEENLALKKELDRLQIDFSETNKESRDMANLLQGAMRRIETLEKALQQKESQHAAEISNLINRIDTLERALQQEESQHAAEISSLTNRFQQQQGNILINDIAAAGLVGMMP